MSLSRRHLISSAAGLAFAGFARAASSAPDAQADGHGGDVYGYGPLRRDPAGLFDLPAGFSYDIVSRQGEPMSDGLLTPGKADGMGCFPLGGDRVVLVRNHECKHADMALSPYGRDQALLSKVDRGRVYDINGNGQPLLGGTTTLVWDLKARKLESCHLSLAGTTTNCAGGTTPWGSWLSCEEAVDVAGDHFAQDHGFVFEVPAAARGLVKPRPLKAMGRFKHEAAAIDPRTGVIYLTEDEYDGRGLFYRFLPNDPTRLHKGGRLQALGLKDRGGDLRNWDMAYWRPGDFREVVWIDLDGVDNPHGDLRDRGHSAGAAWLARGEGVFFGDGSVFIAATFGGKNKWGHILRYRPSPFEGRGGETDSPGVIELFAETADPSRMEMADNIAVSPWGHLFVCEDKQKGVNHLRAVTPDGRLYTIARNAKGDGAEGDLNSELAGVCFSPGGETLFVNIYRPGLTLAVRGPWGRFRIAA